MQTTSNNTVKLMAEITLEKALNQLKKEVEMETWRRAEEMVVEKADIIEKLLQSDESMIIRQQAKTERFIKLCEQRQRLYTIQHQLYAMAHQFHLEWCRAARK